MAICSESRQAYVERYEKILGFDLPDCAKIRLEGDRIVVAENFWDNDESAEIKSSTTYIMILADGTVSSTQFREIKTNSGPYSRVSSYPGDESSYSLSPTSTRGVMREEKGFTKRGMIDPKRVEEAQRNLRKDAVFAKAFKALLTKIINLIF